METPQADDPAIFDVSGEGLYTHLVGNKKCEEGFCNGKPYGWPANCICGGLIHADFRNAERWLIVKCDRCGDDYAEA